MHFAVAIQKAAAAGVEGFVVFHDDHGFLDSVERRAAAFEHAPTRSHGVAHAVEMGFDHVVRNGPGAAMNYQNRIVQEESSERKRTIRIAGAAAARTVWAESPTRPRPSAARRALLVPNIFDLKAPDERLWIEFAGQHLAEVRSDRTSRRPVPTLKHSPKLPAPPCAATRPHLPFACRCSGCGGSR